MKKACAVAVASFIWMASAASEAGPRTECASAGATLACLDAKLREANQKLNVTLKAAQERLEQLQAQGGRPMMGAFVDSQRKFNAYRDAQCSWQGVRAAPGENSAEYVRECQLLETLAREQELAAFAEAEHPVAQEDTVAAPPIVITRTEPPPADYEPATPVTVDPPPPQSVEPTPPPPQPATGKRGVEWRLTSWVVGGQQKQILQDQPITIAFDPAGKVAGHASVNRFSGPYRFDADGRLVWPPAGFAVTRMAGPPALMAQERAFLESLRRTVRYRFEGQQLVLENANGSVRLGFTR